MNDRKRQVNRAIYWAIRKDVYEVVERLVTRNANDAANRASYADVSRAVDTAAGWAIDTTLHWALHHLPHPGLQDFLRGIERK